MLLEDGKMLQLTLDESFREKGTSDKIYIDTAHFPQMLYSIRKGDRIDINKNTLLLGHLKCVDFIHKLTKIGKCRIKKNNFGT